MALHVLHCKRPLCHCLRVPHPHRPASFPLCEQAMWSDLLKAALEGASHEQLADIAADIAWNAPGKPSVECPF